MSEDSNKTLKRGLGALLGNEEKPKETASDASNANANANAYASVDKISAGRFQARTDITQESLEELKDSIKSQGVIQPLIVRKSPSGDYELVAGERRLRASKMAGLEEVPIVIKNLSDEEIIKMGLIENLQREDLNPLDEARGIQRLQKEFNLTILFIAHDLSVVKHISSDIGVMYLGNLVESGNSENIFKNPQHDYTKKLLTSIPIPDPKNRKERKKQRLENK